MGRRFAGEVSGVKFLEGGVDVLDVEQDSRRYPFVGVVLNDLKGIVLNRVAVEARAAPMRENEAFAPGRNDVHRDVRQQSDLGGHPQVFDCSISTLPEPGIHDPAAIVATIILGKVLRHGIPVAGREMRQEALVPPRFPAAVPAG